MGPRVDELHTPLLVSTKPRFCIIAPTQYLKKYASQSNTHLVLAHLVDTNPTYAAFYRELKATDNHENDFVIMDNGAFELGKSYEPTKLIDLALSCNADAIVLPDYPFEPGIKTIKAAEAIIDDVTSAGFKTIFVPQSETGDIEDWISTYEFASDIADIIGMSILGIPNALPHVHKGYARVVMTQILQDRGIFDYDMYHHYLGLNSGPALEIPSLIKINALDSCDSSGPVWAGICGHMYSTNTDSLMSTSKIKKPVDFDYLMTDDQRTHNIIQHNISLTLNLFTEGQL